MEYQILSFSTSPFTQNRIYSLLCDTAADLPASVDGYSVGQGWTAKVIEDGSSYIANAAGSWIQQPSSVFTSNYYTKTETDGRLSAHVCQCDTAGNVADKVATTTDDFVLRDGAIIAVKFANNNSITDTSAHPITINVNNTGKYRIYYLDGSYVSGTLPRAFGYANYYTYYVFSIDRWVFLGYSGINTYNGMTQAQASSGVSNTNYLITPKILHDTIIEQTNPLKSVLTDIVNTGSKNKLKLTDTTTTTKQGVTITYNGDGTYTLDSAGSPSSGADFFYLARTSENPIFPAGSVISGCSGGTDSTYRLQIAGTTIYQTDEPTTLAADTSGSLIFYFAAGQTFYNMILSPMVCSGIDYSLSPTFEPYCPTLAELYQLVKSYHP